MAEGKKREFHRKTTYRVFQEFCERAGKYNKGEADLPYPDRITDAYLFGSYVNSTKEKLHDLDIAIVVDENRDKSITHD